MTPSTPLTPSISSTPPTPYGKQSLVLVGPRAAGKSTLARALGKHLERPVADADDLLAAAVGCPVGEYLARVGEAAFRRQEESIVTTALATNAGAILALGGGAVLSKKIRSILTRPEHFVVFLSAPVSVLVERWMGAESASAASQRPPLTDLPPAAEVERLLRDRWPLYEEVCDLAIDTFSANVAACMQSITANMSGADG